MNAIVPLNVTAIRVNNNDASNIVQQFKGATAVFNKLPYNSSSKQTSTGDMIVAPLNKQASPGVALNTGIHVHWLLPDYFKKGVQQSSGSVVFPAAPNRWLVTRYLSRWNGTSYEAPQATTFMVESDYVAGTLQPDPWGVFRPCVSVPLPSRPVAGQQPYMYMGRVVQFSSWNPSGEPLKNYLPAQNDAAGNPLYLTAIGFVGPSFSSYYPECNSVFGFWDHFKDQADIYAAINNNTPIQFKASYQVSGWINEADSDPLYGLTQTITNLYNTYVDNCNAQGTPVVQTPGDVFSKYMLYEFNWSFVAADITWTLNSEQKIETLNIPQSTLCSGIMQEVVWNMENSPNAYFLNNPNVAQSNSGVWNGVAEIAIGNTVQEALSALLKNDLGDTDNVPNEILSNYEYLLDALQLGLLNDIDNQTAKLINLEESLHSAAFSKQDGGLLWIISQQNSGAGQAPNPDSEITLPLALAEQLNQLNMAQKNYDQGRKNLSASRKQLFMDWLHFVKLFVNPAQKDNVSLNQLSAFLISNDAGELYSVTTQSNSVGILQYNTDTTSGSVISPMQPGGDAGSLAAAVYNAFTTLQNALQQYPGWVIGSAPAPPFWTATEPVILLEGDTVAPAKRNSDKGALFVRTSNDIINTIEVAYGSAPFNVNTSLLPGLPAINPAAPQAADLTQLSCEAFALIPSMAILVGNWLAAVGGGDNPASENLNNFILTLQNAQGGLSPLESATTAGLYAAIRVADYVPAANPQQTVSSPQNITFTFTNSVQAAWLADASAWNAQTAVPELSTTRVDPFLPVSMTWNVTYWPLKTNNAGNYNSENITDYFTLNPDGVDYEYLMDGGTPVSFTSNFSGQYSDWITLSSKASFSIVQQIQNYINNYPPDENNPNDLQNKVDNTLQNAIDGLQKRNFLAQAISSFGISQTLSNYIARMEVVNLVSGATDRITPQINSAAIANATDNWYYDQFNSVSPISVGPLAEYNFTPLRGGFMEVNNVTIVDVFGQTMVLSTEQKNSDGSMQVICAASMQPQKGDTVNAQKIYLPPRIMAPSRLWFRWLSAAYDPSVPGFNGDFVEMNTHPATSPVTGWIMPNHLDNLLFFYDADGSPIGSFSVEHDALVYHTRPGNGNNTLQDDIGTPQDPTVNPGVASFMWYINGQTVGFFNDLMSTILASDAFINPSNFAQDPSLAVLIGRPLALARAVVALESAGNVLPVSQADVTVDDPFPQDVINNRYQYSQRQQSSTANLSTVQFPLRLGDMPNTDDGLVGYIIENAEGDLGSTFYSPAAPEGASNGVEQPSETNILLTLNNQQLQTFTILLDPRAAVHATTGILPVNELRIPPDQYSETLQSLEATFFTHPILQQQNGLIIPLPQESDYSWSWINPGNLGTVPLQSSAGNEFTFYGYSSQTLLEGWTQLKTTPES